MISRSGSFGRQTNVMPFQYSLQAVLDLRRSVEQQQELRLRVANQLVARVHDLIARFDVRIAESHACQARELEVGTTSAELRFESLSVSALVQKRQDAERELGRLEKIRDEQQKIFQYARRQRETLDALRERQLHDYERSLARREQRSLDDLFLMRRSWRSEFPR